MTYKKRYLAILFFITFLSLKSQNQLDAAKKAYDSKNWKKVVNLYSLLSKASPYNGDFYYKIGRANFMLRKYVKAKLHFKQAIKYGISTNNGYAYYYLARIEARLGNIDETYNLLSKAIDFSPDYLEISKKEIDFKEYITSKKFIKLLGISHKQTRKSSEEWREELLYLKDRMEKSHYDIFHFTSKEKWNSIISDFYDSIPKMNTIQILTKFSEIGALAMDSHTYANPMFGNALGYRYHMIPVEFYYFGNKLFVRAALQQYSSLVGKEVIKIGDYLDDL